ncbi:MAG: hypothetical protein IJ220_02615 [Clostridia bacterium]|nr:hypothetical protein [Clostridia bacterium]
MDRATSREEIEDKIKNIDKEIELLRQANDGFVDFASIAKLEDEKEELEQALEEMLIETAQNSGADFEQAQENEEERKKQEEELAQQKVDSQSDLSEEMNTVNGEMKTFNNWEVVSGVVVLPYDGSRSSMAGKEMTREEFMEKISDSVTIVKSPGLAEDFFQYKPDDWYKLRNSKEEFQKVIVKYENDLPTELDLDQAYVLFQNEEDTIPNAENEVAEVDEKQSDTKQKDIDAIKKHVSSEFSKNTTIVVTAKEALQLAEKGMLKEEEISGIVEKLETAHEKAQDAMTNEELNEENEAGVPYDPIQDVAEEIIQESNEEQIGEENNEIISDSSQQLIEDISDEFEEQLTGEIRDDETVHDDNTTGKNVLTSSIDNNEMIDDTMRKNAEIASVTLQLRDALENGIEEEVVEEKEEELLPGMNRRI